MPAYLERDISAAGEDVLAGNNVTHVMVHLTAIGTDARPLEAGVADHHLRVGWVAIGWNQALVPADGGPQTYWYSPIWLDFERQYLRWTPYLMGTSNQLVQAANRVRWYLSLNSAAHLWINGT